MLYVAASLQAVSLKWILSIDRPKSRVVLYAFDFIALCWGLISSTRLYILHIITGRNMFCKNTGLMSVLERIRTTHRSSVSLAITYLE